MFYFKHNILWYKCLTFCLCNLKIETDVGTGEEAGESNPEANDELELSRVSEMRIILGDPAQCILLNYHVVFKHFLVRLILEFKCFLIITCDLLN